MRASVWLIIPSVGFALMVAAYASRERIDTKEPWASGLIVFSLPDCSRGGGQAFDIVVRTVK